MELLASKSSCPLLLLVDHERAGVHALASCCWLAILTYCDLSLVCRGAPNIRTSSLSLCCILNVAPSDLA
jgi:hypothetical protein